MSVMTVLFCGTGSNSFDFANANYYEGELISTLARNMEGTEYVDWIIVDGPGSGNHQKNEKFSKTEWLRSRVIGKLTGHGWTSNVEHAVAMIKGQAKWQREELKQSQLAILQKHDVSPASRRKRVTPQALQMQMQKLRGRDGENRVSQVNVIGWSRGGVTAHKFANAMFADKDLMAIPINIIAVDPVPGLGRFFWKDNVSLPPNVRDYVAFYARDERSFGFEPVLPKMKSTTKRVIYPMPGTHATLVGNAQGPGKGVNTLFDPSQVVRRLCEYYLISWGSRLKNCLGYSDSDMLMCYDRMIEQHDIYKTKRKDTYTFHPKYKRRVGEGGNWVGTAFNSLSSLKSDGLFINWHHRQLFARLHPEAYQSCAPAGTRWYDRRPVRIDETAIRAQATWQILKVFRETGARTAPY